MAPDGLNTNLGELRLRTPLIAASGTVGSVHEWADVADVTQYGAAVAKSVSVEPWKGNAAPRVAPIPTGMLNAIGIQNPGVDSWLDDVPALTRDLDVPVWGSAVGHEVPDFAVVAKCLATGGVAAVEINLSCPNISDGALFSFDAGLAASVVSAVRGAVDIPIGAKLSPDTPDIVEVGSACVEAGADFLVLTNTALGLALDSRGRPALSRGAGGYSGPGLKPISLRCVFEVGKALPDVPLIGCGGVATGRDVVDYLRCGASAVAIGTTHFAEPDCGTRIAAELKTEMRRTGVEQVADLIGAVHR